MMHHTPVAPVVRLRAPLLGAILVVATYCHVVFWPIFTTDVFNDYVPWYNHVVERGVPAAFAAPFGAYTPPYLYGLALMVPFKGLLPDTVIIKLLSMLGNVALGAAFWHLLKRLRVPMAPRYAAMLLALPSVMMNAALLGQCDAMYVAPCVMALAAAVDRKHRVMLAWCGIALAFKAQAVLLAPFILALLIARRVPFWHWFAAPLAFLAAMLPAWAAGWPADDLLTIYFRQADTFHEIARNSPNIWMILEVAGINTGSLTLLAMAATIGTVGAYVARLSVTARYLSTPMLLRAATLAPLITAGLLPRMHERYFLIADVFSLALALISNDRATWWIPALVQTGSTLALLAYLTGIPALAAIGAVAMIAATCLTAQPWLARSANDNPVMPRRA
ncbi:MAG: hypothetical protein ACKVOB_13005 [Sphingomonas sp.]